MNWLINRAPASPTKCAVIPSFSKENFSALAGNAHLRDVLQRKVDDQHGGAT